MTPRWVEFRTLRTLTTPAQEKKGISKPNHDVEHLPLPKEVRQQRWQLSQTSSSDSRTSTAESTTLTTNTTTRNVPPHPPPNPPKPSTSHVPSHALPPRRSSRPLHLRNPPPPHRHLLHIFPSMSRENFLFLLPATAGATRIRLGSS